MTNFFECTRTPHSPCGWIAISRCIGIMVPCRWNSMKTTAFPQLSICNQNARTISIDTYHSHPPSLSMTITPSRGWPWGALSTMIDGLPSKSVYQYLLLTIVMKNIKNWNLFSIYDFQLCLKKLILMRFWEQLSILFKWFLNCGYSCRLMMVNPEMIYFETYLLNCILGMERWWKQKEWKNISHWINIKQVHHKDYHTVL